MHQIAFTIFGYPVHWYGVMAACGFLAAVSIMNYNRKHAGINSEQVSTLMMITMIAGVLGARLFYVVQFRAQYKGNLKEIFMINHGGLVFYGGFILATLSIIAFCKKNKLSLFGVFDAMAPALAIGHAFGRVGCFLNGCCFGKCTTASFGVLYPLKSEPAHRYPDLAHPTAQKIVSESGDVFTRNVYHSLPIVPIQLYEAVGNVVIAIILMILLKKKKLKLGQVGFLYVMLYGVLRFVDEFWRGDHPPEAFYFGVLAPAQFVALFLIPIGAIAFFVLGKKNLPFPEPAIEPSPKTTEENEKSND